MSKKIFDENKIKEISLLFGYFFELNYKLLKQSEDKKSEFTIENVFDFYISSHVISFLKNSYLGFSTSKGTCLNARCIIEGLALKKMIEKNNMPENALELLKLQDSLIEMKQYNKFIKSLNLKTIFPNDFNEKYEHSKKMYYDLLSEKYSSNKIKRIINSNIPFLCNDKLNYYGLIEDYLDADCLQYYSLLSIVIHPNSNEKISSDFINNLSLWIINLLKDNYSNLDKINDSYTLENYIPSILSSDCACLYVNTIKNECMLLDEIEQSFTNCYGNNYVSNTICSISILLKEMSLDKILGLSEQMKCKFKPLMELLSSFFYIYCIDGNVTKRFKLLQMHDELAMNKAINKNINFDKSYKIYLSIYPNGVDQKLFEKNFLKPTGFLIDEKGDYKNITQLVKIITDLFEKENEKSLRPNIMMIDYVESQMLSHANGYMWFANSGAWGDINNIYLDTNAILYVMFKEIVDLIQNDKELKCQEKYKIIINALNKFSESLKEINKIIIKLQSLPQMQL